MGHDVTIHRQFEEQVDRTPDKVAVTCNDDRVTYRTLNERANQLAAHLEGVGIGVDGRVGIHLHTGIDLVVAALAVLKCGAAYVPLDPAYPQARLDLMATDAHLGCIITTGRLAARLSPGPASGGAVRVQVDADRLAIAAQHSGNVNRDIPLSTLAYIMFTSGSTGRPHGVMVEHRNVANFFVGMDERIPFEEPGRWLALTSFSFDISVLELFWTLTRGFEVVLDAATATRPVSFSVFSFPASRDAPDADPYRLLFDAARFADEHGFEAVWTPERHFHGFGGLYPNPSVTSAALAATTNRVAIRAGSVVLPLHHPARVAEEWAVVDNISAGRVGVSFAPGWHGDDFVLRGRDSTGYDDLDRGIDSVRRLWRGEAVAFSGPDGIDRSIRTSPRPVQAELPTWVTAAGNPDTFRFAGRIGANVLTHLLGQTLGELEDKIAIYRESWRAHGHGPGDGQVSLMLHTFVGHDTDTTRELVREPLTEYLASSLSLIEGSPSAWAAFKRRPDGTVATTDVDVDQLGTSERAGMLEYAFERCFETNGMFGAPERCAAIAEDLRAVGVDEIACLVDFGLPADAVLESLNRLDQVRQLVHTAPRPVDRADRIAALIHEHGITHVQCVPSLASMMTRNTACRDALGHLEVLIVGGEALAPDLAADLGSLTTATLINMYGPTETTIWSSTDVVERHCTTTSIGRPIVNTTFHVLDEHRRPVVDGTEGELWIGGDGVARGYFGRPEVTAERFVADPFATSPDGRLFRTGDLVRARPDGRFDFLGRVDHQVKVRGFRIEPGEIESLMRDHPSVGDAVVVDVVTAHDKRLVAYVTPDRGLTPDPAALRAELRTRLPDYMVPARIVVLDRLPQTANGKIDRGQLRAAGLSGRSPNLHFVAPRGPVECAIARIWQDVLGVDDVGALDGFFDLGGHSLVAMEAHQRIELQLGRTLSVADLFRYPTVRALAAFVAVAESAGDVPPSATSSATPTGTDDAAGGSQLSFAQERLWFSEQLQPGGPAYNDPFTIEIVGPLDQDALHRSLNALVDRHEILRTSFTSKSGRPTQAVAPMTIPLASFDLSHEPAERRRDLAVAHIDREVARPFRLDARPLLRATLIRIDATEHVLVLVFQHAIIDGGSISVLLDELSTIYPALERGDEPVLAPVSGQYREFVARQRTVVSDIDRSAELGFWCDYLRDAPLTLGLARHHQREAVDDHRAALCTRVFDASTTEAIRSLCGRESATPFMVVTAAVGVLLGRLTAEQQIIIGTPFSERSLYGAQQHVGLFLNVLALRVDLSGDPTFAELVGRVRTDALSAFEHAVIPFQDVVRAVGRHAESGRSPLFDVMINHDSNDHATVACGDVTFTVGDKPAGAAREMLELYVNESGGRTELRLLHSLRDVDGGRAGEMLAQLVQLIDQAVVAPDDPVGSYSLVTPAASAWLPDLAVPVLADLPPFSSVVATIAARTALEPDRTAVVEDHEVWTYGELADRASVIAGALVRGGVRRGDAVAVCGERTFELVATMVGVLQAGGVLVLIDPDLPAARRRQLLDESGSAAHIDLRTSGPRGGREDEWGDTWPLDPHHPADASVELPTIAPDDAAYVCFTSGSTGTPKAVLGTHRGLAHFVEWQRDEFAVGPGDRSAQLTAVSFDVVLRDVFTPLVSGAELHLPPPGFTLGRHDVVPWLRTRGITMLHTVPTLLAHWVGGPVEGAPMNELRLLFVAGEPLPGALVGRWRTSYGSAATIVNLYGPTETTLAVCRQVVAAHPTDGVQPIGRAIPGTQVWVAGEDPDQFRGIDEPGEIIIRSPFRTRGYLRPDPEQQRRFVDNPARPGSDDQLYRTGDRGRTRADGSVDFLGRLDEQVKLHGRRIDLREVEAVLLRHPGVRQCAVLFEQRGAAALGAYVTAATTPPPTGADLRAHLEAELPHALVPSAFVVLEVMPQLPSGKIDRSALGGPHAPLMEASSADRLAPRTAIERQLAEIWSALLGQPSIGMRDDFFAAGGHSMLALELLARIDERLGDQLMLPDLIRCPTIEMQARHIVQLRAARTPPSEDEPSDRWWRRRRRASPI